MQQKAARLQAFPDKPRCLSYSDRGGGGVGGSFPIKEQFSGVEDPHNQLWATPSSCGHTSHPCTSLPLRAAHGPKTGPRPLPCSSLHLPKYHYL